MRSQVLNLSKPAVLNKPAISVRREVGIALLRLLDEKNWRRAWRLHSLFHAARKVVFREADYPYTRPDSLLDPLWVEIIFYPEVDNGLERSVFFTGTYEAGTLAVMAKILGPGDIFVDVGANVGLMSLYAGQLVGTNGQVFSVEPIPTLFGQLNENIILNGFANIHAYNLALGAHAERRVMYEHPEINRGSASAGPCWGSEGWVGGFGQHPRRVRHGKRWRRGDHRIHQDRRGRLGSLKCWRARQCISHDAASLWPSDPLQGGELIDLYRFIVSVNSYRCFKLERGKATPSASSQ